MHQMAQTTNDSYSHQQDMEQFNQTLTTLRERYDDNRRAGISSDNEAEFIAYRLILASLYANSQLENELHSLPNDLRNNRRVLTAIEIFKSAKSAFTFGSDRTWIQSHANWKKFWDLIKSPSVSYLMACAAEVTFNRVRHMILDSIWHAYRRGSRGDVVVEAWTTDQLKDVLAMDDVKDAVRLCELYGFQFGRSKEGHTFLDISKMGNSNESLGVPHTVKPQTFSQSLVESKRYNRAFSAIIQGMTVQQARSSGLLVDPNTVRTGAEDSLFIPETSTPSKPNVFGQNANNAQTNGSSNLSPFASPFQPPSQPASVASTANPFGNPFVNAKPQAPPSQAAPSSTLGTTPGLFDSTKNAIKFAPTPTPTTNDNPFAKAATTFPMQSTTPSTTPPGSFNFGLNTSSTPPAQTPNDQTTSVSGGATNQPAVEVGKPFVFPGLSELDAKMKGGQVPAASTTPSGSPPAPDAAAQAAQKEKAEADARAAVLKQKQEAEERRKREQEEQERKAREAQQAREAEQRRIEEERQRKLREQQERELREKQARERLILEEKQQRQREEQELLARIQRRETAYNSLTSNIVFSGEEGLLYQFLENTVRIVAEEGFKEWQAQKQEEYEAVEREKKRLAFARGVFAHWVAQVQRKKRTAKAKERRRRLKAQRERSLNGESEAASETAVAETITSTDQDNRPPTTSSAPVNNRRVRRTQQRRAVEQVSPVGKSSQPRAASSQHAQKSSDAATMTNGHTRSYSEAYHKSTAPIDRTETDWFKLRAMGIDPSRHRKRSFDSATEEEHKGDTEIKRLRRSDSNASLTSQPVQDLEAPSKPLTIEERLARIRAVKQSFGSSVSGSPPVNGATPNKRSSLNGRSSLLIAQARELITKSPSTKQSPITVHDFGRSVPNLGASTSSFRQSILGRSVGTAQGNKPAYWGRASRFVPQHLYGKGPDAIRAYRDQYIHSPSSTPQPLDREPLALSSPIHAQYPYNPQPQYSETESASGVDLVDADAETNVPGDTEEDSFDGDDEEIEYDDDEEVDDEEDEDEEEEEEDDPAGFGAHIEDYDEEEEYSNDEDEQFAHPGSSLVQDGPGATQDDAIELSD